MRNPMAESQLRAALWKTRFPGSRAAQAGGSFARRIAQMLSEGRLFASGRRGK